MGNHWLMPILFFSTMKKFNRDIFMVIHRVRLARFSTVLNFRDLLSSTILIDHSRTHLETPNPSKLKIQPQFTNPIALRPTLYSWGIRNSKIRDRRANPLLKSFECCDSLEIQR